MHTLVFPRKILLETKTPKERRYLRRQPEIEKVDRSKTCRENFRAKLGVCQLDVSVCQITVENGYRVKFGLKIVGIASVHPLYQLRRSMSTKPSHRAHVCKFFLSLYKIHSFRAEFAIFQREPEEGRPQRPSHLCPSRWYPVPM